MTLFLKNIFSGKKSKEVIDDITSLSKNMHDFNFKKEALESQRIDLLKKQGDDYYISLNDFFSFLEKEELSIDDILDKSKHVAELTQKQIGFVEVYAIGVPEGVLLTADKPQGSKTDKIKIVTFRKK